MLEQVFTHERLHQLVIPRPQAAIQHLIQGSIRFVELISILFICLLSPCGVSPTNVFEILTSGITKSSDTIQEMLILAAMQAVDIFHQIRHTVCLKYSRGILRH